ncbi:hypothetical protein [Leptospira alexanderi]|uniref:hypothetical protein n=1 Tax=Leptospira alexanderi TaxID=100053 RepID=UPI0009913C3A|nr:hypothetical protein [Leptospira alexanderi]
MNNHEGNFTTGPADLQMQRLVDLVGEPSQSQIHKTTLLGPSDALFEKLQNRIRESRTRILGALRRYRGRIRYLENQVIERDLALESANNENKKLRAEIADIRASFGFKAVV